MNIRLATLDDAPALWGIVEDYDHKIGTDEASGNDQLNPDFITAGIADQEIIVLTDDQDYPIGAAFFENPYKDLRRDVHFIIRPEWLLSARRYWAIHQMLDIGFQFYGMKKACALISANKTTAIKLAKRLKMKQGAPMRKHVYQDGKATDVYPFEIRRSYWNKAKKLHGRFVDLAAGCSNLYDTFPLGWACEQLRRNMA